MNMEYLAIALLSCLVGACGTTNTKAIEGEMPFTQGTPTKTLLQEMPRLVGMPLRFMIFLIRLVKENRLVYQQQFHRVQMFG